MSRSVRAYPRVRTECGLSRQTNRVVNNNLTCVLGYHVAALPACCRTTAGPTLVGLATGLSSVAVVANSLRLRRFSQLPPSFEDLECLGSDRPKQSSATTGDSGRLSLLGEW